MQALLIDATDRRYWAGPLDMQALLDAELGGATRHAGPTDRRTELGGAIDMQALLIDAELGRATRHAGPTDRRYC